MRQYNVTAADLQGSDLINAADYALNSFQVVQYRAVSRPIKQLDRSKLVYRVIKRSVRERIRERDLD